MKYKLDIVTLDDGSKIYWVMCGAYAVGKFYSIKEAEEWITNNPDWDCTDCTNC